MSSPETPLKPGTAKRSDFIRDIIGQHLKEGRYSEVVTRFPPEPNGFLHIGHAKSICLNFGIARDYGGRCHLRMDDTDPTKEDVSYVESIIRDVRWLGFDWNGHLYHAADYFGRLIELAVKLIEDGKAYVDSLNEQEIREYRGTVTAPGKDSPYRSRSVEENLDLFHRMRQGEFPDGAHVLRAKIDMSNPNMKMRDPLLYRIRHAHHYRAGDGWHIYPMYDFAHPVSDALEGVTHSICTLEFENNRELYDWVLDATGFTEPRPHQYEFARLNLNYSVMSKRKFLQLVEEKHVSGWDDPRMPTISGLRRRGYTPESIRNFCEDIGVAKANSIVDMGQMEHHIRDDLNRKVPRVLGVLRPLKVVIENYPEGRVETLDAPLYPHDVPLEGSRPLTFTRELYIERDDFTETPPKGYYRLAPGAEVRLRHAYVIRCEQVFKDGAGNIIELWCSYDPDTRSGSATDTKKVKGTIHWVSASHGKKAEVRLYDRLFNTEAPQGVEDLNPNSLEVLSECWLEPYAADAEPGSRFQFERQGYFYLEPEGSRPGVPVFNRIVSLKDSWARAAASEQKLVELKKAETPKAPSPKKEAPPAHMAASLTPEQEARFAKLRQVGVAEEEARVLAESDERLAFLGQARQVHDNAQGLANWLVNELLRAAKDKPLDSLTVGPKELAGLVRLIDDETISGKIAKDVLAEMLKSGGSPDHIVETKGLRQIADPAVLELVVDKVLAANPENVAQYRAGRQNLFGFFVGQVLKATDGKANPKLVNDLLIRKLG